MVKGVTALLSRASATKKQEALIGVLVALEQNVVFIQLNDWFS